MRTFLYLVSCAAAVAVFTGCAHVKKVRADIDEIKTGKRHDAEKMVWDKLVEQCPDSQEASMAQERMKRKR